MLGGGAGFAPSSFVGAIGFIFLLGLFAVSSFVRQSRAQSRLRLVGDEVSSTPRSYDATSTVRTGGGLVWSNQATAERTYNAVCSQPAPTAPLLCRLVL